MTATYIALATITLTSTDSEIVFSSIPATYRDLIVVCNYTNTSNAEQVIVMRFNGSSANGSMVGMRGNGSTAASYSVSEMFLSYAGGVSTSPQNAIVQIMDYSATDKHKTSLVRSDSSTLKTEAMANRWAVTSAVTSVSFVTQASAFASGSTFSLYGIN